MNPNDYKNLLGSLSSIGQSVEVHEVNLKLSQTFMGNNLEISLPDLENDVVFLDISPPIFISDPPQSMPPPQAPKVNVANVSVPVHSRDEALATAYGFVAGTNFKGLSWPMIQEEVKADWQLCSKGVAWETAESRVHQAWAAVNSLLQLYKLPE